MILIKVESPVLVKSLVIDENENTEDDDDQSNAIILEERRTSILDK